MNRTDKIWESIIRFRNGCIAVIILFTIVGVGAIYLSPEKATQKESSLTAVEIEGANYYVDKESGEVFKLVEE